MGTPRGERRWGVSRRAFFGAGLRLGAGLVLGGVSGLLRSPLALAQGRDAIVPGKERMIVRSLRYLNLEMPVHLLDSVITPVELFYVRNHVAYPSVNLAEWRLVVSGEVEKPLELTYDELQRREAASVTNTLECAGNGRAFHRPRVPGLQWVRGAVGNATFSGPRLADLLRRAGLKAGARHVAFNGLDEPPGKVPDFIRSIPLEKALHPDTLLATHMNGARLSIYHGFPVRALVAGWLGAASVKWLTEIRVLRDEFDGNFMKPAYRMPSRPVAPGAEVSADATEVITALPVKSIIARPSDGAHLKLAPLRIVGAAWAGEQSIVRVDISTDGGSSWQTAGLSGHAAPYAWRLWERVWQPPGPGYYAILSRATDSAGRTQPVVAAWNASGYLWNAVDQVGVHVEA